MKWFWRDLFGICSGMLRHTGTFRIDPWWVLYLELWQCCVSTGPVVATAPEWAKVLKQRTCEIRASHPLSILWLSFGFAATHLVTPPWFSPATLCPGISVGLVVYTGDSGNWSRNRENLPEEGMRPPTSFMASALACFVRKRQSVQHVFKVLF